MIYSKNPRLLIEQLVENAKREGFINEDRFFHGIDLTKKSNCPGYVILNLPQQVRNVLKNLKSDDLKTHLLYRPEK